MTQEELRRIYITLNKEKEHEYYVYMLLNAGTPFYIGKGKKTRVFQHEMEAGEILESIKEGREDDAANYDGLSEKIKRIIENKGQITKVIVKWGMTEDEAFMCESALMNMYESLIPQHYNLTLFISS